MAVREHRGEGGAGAGGADVVILTRGLTKLYDDLVAVDRLDLEVRRGEVFGLLGPNGAGKTTTILMLLGLTEPTAGEAEVVGLDPTRHPLEVKSRVGYMPDNVGFYGGLTGRENLRYTARLNGLKGRDAEDRIDSMLVQVGLTGAADRPAGQYSRGMRQRLGVADALVKDPDVLILDEPTVGIDPEGVAEMLELIRRLADERGVALLLSSHLLHQVQSVCDRVGIFVAGRMVAQGPMADLADHLAGGRVTLEVGAEGPLQEVEGRLRGLEHVITVLPHPRHPGIWVVRATADIRRQVAAIMTGGGVALTELRRVDQELDEIYRRYFAEEGHDGDA